MIRYMTGGESHGKGLVAILEGIPAGLTFSVETINEDLKRRQGGYGRGGRMAIESDTAEIISGIRKNTTIGTPISVFIKNNDYKIDDLPDIKTPRPGHADLVGMQKYGFGDARSVLERASARETAAKVAVGAICKIFLKNLGINIESKVLSIGGESELANIKKKIDEAKNSGNTLGGVFAVKIKGVMPGIGSYAQWNQRLDGRLARAIMSIPAVKAFEIGEGIKAASLLGSVVHDAIEYKNKEFKRVTNNAGGIEGGMSNGEEIILKGFMKPISTLMNPLDTVNIDTKTKDKASTERSDTSAVEACAVVAEAVCAIEIAKGITEKFGCDFIEDIIANIEVYKERLKKM